MEKEKNENQQESTEIPKGYIPKARFDEVNTAKKELEQKNASLSEELAVAVAEIAEIATLRERVEALTAEKTSLEIAHAEKLATMELESAISQAIARFGGKNAKAVKALLDIPPLSECDDIQAELAKQLTVLAKEKDSAFLFEKRETFPQIVGAVPSQSADECETIISLDTLKQMSAEERYHFARTNPDGYKKIYGGI